MHTQIDISRSRRTFSQEIHAMLLRKKYNLHFFERNRHTHFLHSQPHVCALSAKKGGEKKDTHTSSIIHTHTHNFAPLRKKKTHTLPHTYISVLTFGHKHTHNNMFFVPGVTVNCGELQCDALPLSSCKYWYHVVYIYVYRYIYVYINRYIYVYIYIHVYIYTYI